MDRREFVQAASSAIFFGSPNDWISLADLRSNSQGQMAEDIFAQAFLRSRNISVPAGVYRLTPGASIIVPTGARINAAQGAIIVKSTNHDHPALDLTNSSDVNLSGLTIRGPTESIFRIAIGKVDQLVALPFAARAENTVSVVLINSKRTVLQGGVDYNVIGASILLKKAPGVSSILEVRREESHNPLVLCRNSKRVSLEFMRIEQGGVWITGSPESTQCINIKASKFLNSQIKIWGETNIVTPFRTGMVRSEFPSGPSGIFINNNSFVGKIPSNAVKRYVRFGERAAGIEVHSQSHNVVIEANEIEGQAGDGVWLASANSASVKGNVIRNNALSGIGLECGVVKGTNNSLIESNLVEYNWFDGCDFNFVSGPEDSYNCIRGNHFHHNGYDIDELTGGCGIYMNRISNAIIESNVCTENNIAGILCKDSSSCRIIANTYLANGRSVRVSGEVGKGVAVVNSTDMTVVGNSEESR
jgi:parallel beta-helix repeat protein